VYNGALFFGFFLLIKSCTSGASLAVFGQKKIHASQNNFYVIEGIVAVNESCELS
jgi:hypothetical protein